MYSSPQNPLRQGSMFKNLPPLSIYTFLKKNRLIPEKIMKTKDDEQITIHIILLITMELQNGDDNRTKMLERNIVDNAKPVELQSVNQAAFLCFLIQLSQVYYGYSLSIIGASDYPSLQNYYSISMQKEVALALMNGALPIGGMLGCVLFPKLRLFTSKKKLHYYLSFATLLFCGLSILPAFPLVVICRFFIGIICAQYMALSVNLLKEHFTDFYWKPFGAAYSAMRILGILIAYIIGTIFIQNNAAETGHIFLFLGPAIISFFQALTLGYNLPESPVEMLRANQLTKAAQSLELLYNKEDADRRLNQLRLKIQRSIPSKFDTIKNPLNIAAMHCALLRQFCGVTYLVVYSGNFPLHRSFALNSSAAVIQNAIQLMGGIIGIAMVMKFSRYKMLTISTVILLILNVCIGIASIFNQPGDSFAGPLGFSSICVFMFICGSCLTSVAWVYPAELATPGLEKYSAVTSMGGTATIAIVPPFVVLAMSDGSAYPIFFFFALYLGIAVILNPYLIPRDSIEVKMPEIELALGA